jgi:site-specific recombinase XerD
MTRPKPKPTIQELLTSFELALRADNKANTTIKSYLEALDLFDAYLDQHGLPRVVKQIERQHVTHFKADQVARGKPTTAANRFKSLQQFFRWAVSEEELDYSPMDGLQAPHVPEVPVDAIRAEELERLFKACSGRDFRDRRDTAILSLFCDTGMRCSEMAHITLASLHLERK